MPHEALYVHTQCSPAGRPPQLCQDGQRDRPYAMIIWAMMLRWISFEPA